MGKSETLRTSDGKHWRWLAVVTAAVLLCGLTVQAFAGSSVPKTEAGVVKKYRAKVDRRLEPRFRFAGVNWPPEHVVLLTLKETRRLELWAEQDHEWRFIREYRIKGYSGTLGPKLAEGDRQVPEGFYRIKRLNPNSGFHLSMELDFPNRFDREQAKREGRREPGTDIYIHGRNVSTGCIALGDNAIEELFVLTSLIGKENVSVVITPRDFRIHPVEPIKEGLPSWAPTLYDMLADGMRQFPLEQK